MPGRSACFEADPAAPLALEGAAEEDHALARENEGLLFDQVLLFILANDQGAVGAGVDELNTLLRPFDPAMVTGDMNVVQHQVAGWVSANGDGGVVLGNVQRLSAKT